MYNVADVIGNGVHFLSTKDEQQSFKEHRGHSKLFGYTIPRDWQIVKDMTSEIGTAIGCSNDSTADPNEIRPHVLAILT